jgi:lysophospholipase L1-like esterase
MRRFQGAGLLTLLAGLATGGGAAEAPDQQFQAGDRWAVVGDSITHGRRYHSFIYLFHATRYPEREFRSFNCGISGDSAAGAVQRFEWDIGVHQPTVATVMLGMNDVGRGLYAPGQSGAAVEARRRTAIEAHLQALTQLTERLQAQRCRVIFITPSIFDQTGTLPAENCVGVNDALGLCGEGARGIAARLGAAVIDLHGPMTALNARLQQADPAATLVGPDRVHPGDPGQLVMAYTILKGQGVSGVVAEMSVAAAAGQVTAAGNCRITEQQCQGGTVSFTCQAASLPYPVLPAAEAALAWVPFMADLNREMLTVTGLPPGQYAVLVDGQPVTAAADTELAAGLNLAGNPRSPMLKQALRVMAVEEKRQAVAARMRTFAAQRHWLVRGNPALDPDNFEAMKAALLADLETKKNAANYAYFKGQVDTYITWKPREAELRQELEESTAAIWQLNRPQPHRFEIRPLTPADQALLAGRVLDDGDDATLWQRTSWTDTEPTLAVADGSLAVSAPRTAGRRDMLGLSKAVSADLADVKLLKIRYRADQGAPFGVEVVLDGKLTRLRSYEKATGAWEELALPIAGARLTGLTLILAEAGPEAVWLSERVAYTFDRIWLE